MPRDREVSRRGQAPQEIIDLHNSRTKTNGRDTMGEDTSSGTTSIAGPPDIPHWDGIGKPANLFRFDYCSRYEGTHKDSWISAEEISVDVLAHCMRRKDECFTSSCEKFCCPANGILNHLNLHKPSLVLYVFQGKRGFVISEDNPHDYNYSFKLSRVERESLQSQSYQYAMRNGFFRVDELSKIEFGAAQWIDGAVPSTVLRAGGAKGVRKQKKSYAGATFCTGCGHWTPFLKECHKCGAMVQDPDIDATLKGDPLIQAAVVEALAHRIDGQDVAEVTSIGSLIIFGFVLLAGVVGISVRR